MNRNLTPIATAVALLVLSTAVQAQQAAPAAKENKDEAQTVIVTGIRAALQQSLNQKRNAESHVDVITAEDIGKMPDKNVADSLARVPGVTISSASANEGGFDENDRVSMRGTNPSLTQTLINGHNVASGEWFVLNQTGTVGRSVSYTLLPSELVGKVVVHKSPEASLVEGGVAGSVDIVTRKPLDFKKQFTAEGAVGVVYADQPGKTAPQLSALINWKNPDNNLGIMVQAFSEKRHLRRDGQELLGYERIAAGSNIARSNPDLAGVWYPTLIGSALFEQERHRTGGLIDVQIKPSKDLMFDFTAFTSKMDAANYNRNYMLWGSRILNQGQGQAPNAGYVVRNGTLVSATFAPVAGNQYGVYDQISRPDASSDSNFFNFDTKWRVNDALTLYTKLGTSKGNGKTPTQDVAEWNTGIGSGASWRLNGVDSAADWSLGTANNASPTGLALGWIFGDQFTHVKDKEDWGQLDGEYTLDAGPFNLLKFGARWAEHSRSSAGVVGQAPGCIDSAGNNRPWDWSQTYWCPVGTRSPADPANFPTGGFSMYPGDFGNGLGGSFPKNIWYYTPAQLTEYNKLANRSRDGSRLNWGNEFSLNETSTALYLQGNMEGDGWSGNVGVRAVQTKEHIVRNKSAAANEPGAITTSAFGPYAKVTTKNTFTDILPSLNLRFDLRKDLVGRVSVSKTMTRPDYSALAGSLSLSPPAVAGGTGSGSGSNANLKPIRSNNIDGTLEWYFADRALASAGLFYMDLNSYVGLGRVRESYMTYSAATPQGVLTAYDITVPVNTSAKVKGAEFALQMPLGKNFGFDTNYTHVNAKDADGGPVVGASKNTYNLSGYFENDQINARLSYTYRSDFYSGLDRATAFSQASVGTVAASLGYKISENFAISLDAQNLNNPKLKYYALNEDQPRSIYQSGRQFYLTLRGKM